MDPKKLKELQRFWNSALKAKGFSDIEDEDGNLKTYASSLQHSISPEEFEERREYFLEATSYVDSEYLSGRDNFIWKLYCEGKEHSQIAKLTGLKGARVSQIIAEIDRRLMRRGRE